MFQGSGRWHVEATPKDNDNNNDDDGLITHHNHNTRDTQRENRRGQRHSPLPGPSPGGRCCSTGSGRYPCRAHRRKGGKCCNSICGIRAERFGGGGGGMVDLSPRPKSSVPRFTGEDTSPARCFTRASPKHVSDCGGQQQPRDKWRRNARIYLAIFRPVPGGFPSASVGWQLGFLHSLRK